jgi:arginase
VTLLLAPFDLGREGTGMGAGPDVIAARLGDAARDAVWIAAPEPAGHDLGTSFAINRALAAQVRDAEVRGERPLVLAGNCHASQALTRAGRGVVWFDAHGDFHTPETMTSGFFDGCALAMVTGEAFRGLCGTVHGWSPVDPAHVVLAGVRDVDPGEEDRFASSPLAVASGGAPLGPALDDLAARVDAVHVHVDLDVLEGPANRLAPPGGLSPDELLARLASVADRFTVASATLASYDPAVDADGVIADAAAAVAERLAAS